MTSKEKFKRYGLPIIMGVIAVALVVVCVIIFLNDPYKPDKTDGPSVSQDDPQQTGKHICPVRHNERSN